MLGTFRVLRAHVHVPPSGAWTASLLLDSSEQPPLVRTVLSMGDLELVGTVVRTGFDDHDEGALVTAVVYGGAGAWRLPVTRGGSYSSTSGVKLSTVLQDLAAMTGESYTAPADATIGEGFRWEQHSPLAPVYGTTVLADLVARGYLPTWRIEPFTGLTRFDAWPSLGPADGRGRITARARARGRRSVGLDVQIAGFLPGATLEGVAIKRTIFTETAGDLRAEVYEQ